MILPFGLVGGVETAAGGPTFDSLELFILSPVLLLIELWGAFELNQ
jgi:hypothetical protein